MFLRNLFSVVTNIRHLYSSRDALWKEVFRLQQTSKRREKTLRRRLHNLERKFSALNKPPCLPVGVNGTDGSVKPGLRL